MSYTLYKTASFGPGRAGLTTVGYTLTGGPRVTAGVAEVGVSTGVYGAAVTFADGFSGAILWDTGQGGSTVYAAEEVNPGPEYLDAKVSTRSTYSGGAVAGVTAPVTVGANNDKTGYSLNLAQTGLAPRALDSVADGALTVGDGLVAAICAAAGKETVVSTAYTVKTPSTGTAIRTFTLDNASTPTTRS